MPNSKNGFKLSISNSFVRHNVKNINNTIAIVIKIRLLLLIVSIPLVRAYIVNIPKNAAMYMIGVLDRNCETIKFTTEKRVVIAIIAIIIVIIKLIINPIFLPNKLFIALV